MHTRALPTLLIALTACPEPGDKPASTTDAPTSTTEGQTTTDIDPSGLTHSASVIVSGYGPKGAWSTTAVASFADSLHPDLLAPLPAIDRCSSSASTADAWSYDPVDAGEVTLSLGGAAVPLESITGVEGLFGFLDGWPEGEPLSLSATGGAFPTFELADLLVLPEAPEGSVAENADGSLTFSWVPGAGAGTRIGLLVVGDAGTFACDVADTGAYTIDAEDVQSVGATKATTLSRVVYALATDGPVGVTAIAIAGIPLL